MRKHLAILRFAVAAPLLVTIFLWLAAKFSDAPNLGWPTDPMRAVSQILSLMTLVMFSIVMVIAARNRSVEKVYGGLDKSYALHGQLAKIAWFGMLLHPLLLIPHMVRSGLPWYSVLAPIGPWPAGFELARWFGVIAYYLFIVLVLLTLFRRIDYQHWLTSHKLMGPAFVAAVAHTYLANSDVRNFEPLRDWITVCAAAGILSWLYKSIFYSFVAQQYAYVVDSIRDMGDNVWELNLKPKGARINYEPGEFAFISVRGNPDVPREYHPFTISSTPGWHVLRFSFRVVGNYTRSLTQAKPGDHVQVYGPYGEFTSYMLDEYKKQVWIGGGIGVTPFLSMLHHEAVNGDPKEITFYYSVKNSPQAVYDQEIRSVLAGKEDQFNYIQHSSDTEGFLTAERLKADVGELRDHAFLFCGPPVMMRTLKKQLIAAGVPPQQIFFEEFYFV